MNDRIASCSGPCVQGRKPCPCPQACRTDDDFTDGGAIIGGLVAIGIVSIVAAVAWAVSVIW